MVMTQLSEPAPEFDAQCLDIFNRFKQGDLPFEDAVKQLNALNRAARDTEIYIHQGRCEHLLGNLRLDRGHINTAIRHYEQARRMYELAYNPRRVAAIDLNIGEGYRYKGDFARARKQYNMAYQGGKETGSLLVETAALANEGQMLIALGEYDEARQALEAAFELAQTWGDDLNQLDALLCEVYQGLATIYLQAGETAQAWEQAKFALEAAKRSKRLMDAGFANRAIANVLTAIGKSPESAFMADPDVYYNLAIEAFRGVNAEAEIGRTLHAQGWSIARRGRKLSAARKFQQALSIFTELGMVDDAAKAAESQLDVVI